MGMRIKIDSGWIGTAISVAASGACVKWPEASGVIAPVLFGIAALVLVFGIRIEGAHLRWVKRRRMLPLVGMIISSASFAGFAAWYWWPVTQSAITLSIENVAPVNSTAVSLPQSQPQPQSVAAPLQRKNTYLRADAEVLIPALRKIYAIIYESTRDSTSLTTPFRWNRNPEALKQGLVNINEFYNKLQRDVTQIYKENISFKKCTTAFFQLDISSRRIERKYGYVAKFSDCDAAVPEHRR